MSKRNLSRSGHKVHRQTGRGVGNVVLRRFDPLHDSYEELTVLLHRAFARLGMMGLNCTCVDQDAALTQRRAQAGDCFVVVGNGKLIGTMTLYSRDAESRCEHYRQRDIASVRQLAIDPSWQNRGIGKSLLAFAEHWAATRGYAELALDTPYPAAHLVAFYRSQGYRIVDTLRFPGKVYDSAILSKAPVVARTLAAWTHQIALPRSRFVRFAA
ncbi:GNAT family N-acetyltransferase [Paraburkholderia pallida]|uniref:GNAT family N-acetyltransferase n=1 Tax=Paraburkholderia pallida TaxID=2547399 RepID=A0A4P7CZF3_9BURK|nr:GNAT family N-acetyltransferase [Paraburkholderia pallida]QBR01741.1 GNAT family N-acetyltransferase [Paraburkholderia pallida]